MDIATYKDFFANKRITLMGLGLLGRGVGDAAFLAPLCKELVITDRKSKDELASSLGQLKDFSNITYVLGEHKVEDFVGADMVIKAAGVPLNSIYIEEAKKAGVPVYMSTALFAKFARDTGATVVGVTGTRGKSTVTHMIHHTLVQAGRRAHIGGNVRGLSTLAMLPEVNAGDIAVLELDSWQLQGFGDLAISPDISVFTNLMEDHLNYYLSELDYFLDKAKIFIHQRPGDTLIAGQDIADRISAMHPPVALAVPPAIPAAWALKIPGEHNRANAALAAEALRALRLSDEQIRSGIESFDGVEGRLQKVATVKGVDIYNDNNATTPDATIAALNAFDTNVILITGGADKGLSLDGLAQTIADKTKKTLLLPGTGTERLVTLVGNTTMYRSVPDALKDALASAEPGDIILFSPAFASFGMFQNEYDRNDQFMSAVKALE